MASTPAQFAAKMTKIAEGIPAANRVALGQSSLAAKETMIAAAGTAGLRPGQRMRGVGKKGAAWGVQYDVKGDTARVGFRGPVHLVEGDTKAHSFEAKSRTRRRTARQYADGAALVSALTGKKVRQRRIAKIDGGGTGTSRAAIVAGTGGAQALKTPFGFRSSVKHPGTKGKRFWSPAKAKVAQQTPPIYQSAHRAAIIRAGFGRS